MRVNNPGSFKVKNRNQQTFSMLHLSQLALQVKNAPAKDKDVWPPNRVLDLKAEKSMDNYLTINFTAPGDDFDSGTREYILLYPLAQIRRSIINR